MPRDVSLCLFRIAQEALQNAVKHSESRDIYISLKGGNDEVELVVQDSGKGFDPQNVTRGLGLISMKERLKLVNGRLSISSQPGRGTIVEVHLPLKKV